MNKKIIIYILLTITLIIQYFDKDGSFRWVQYIIIGISFIAAIYYNVKKLKDEK
ncbi:hypothetical protein N9Q58_04155 [Polaribacter sp.]|nr:hypothetical protein [Polaribacter sp.]